MPGPDPAVAATRVAVRRVLAEVARPAAPAPVLVLVACSGGPDSLALAAAVAFEAPRAGVWAGAVVVDHGLQDDSAAVAARAATTCGELGLDPVLVRPVAVAETGDGPEAAARTARYDALAACAEQAGAALVLLGHSRDDQAEQVLLGLARGSGGRSLAGMPRRRGLFVRPFLELPREVTLAACAAQGLTPWTDPHNADDRYARVRARRVLAAAEAALGPGVGAALARSASLLASDAEALEVWADRVVAQLVAEFGSGPWPVESMTDLPEAVRGRVWRRLAAAAGCPLADVGAVHVRGLDALLTAWRGQGPISLPGGWCGERRDGLVSIGRPPPRRTVASG